MRKYWQHWHQTNVRCRRRLQDPLDHHTIHGIEILPRQRQIVSRTGQQHHGVQIDAGTCKTAGHPRECPPTYGLPHHGRQCAVNVPSIQLLTLEKQTTLLVVL